MIRPLTFAKPSASGRLPPTECRRRRRRPGYRCYSSMSSEETSQTGAHSRQSSLDKHNSAGRTPDDAAAAAPAAAAAAAAPAAAVDDGLLTLDQFLQECNRSPASRVSGGRCCGAPWWRCELGVIGENCMDFCDSQRLPRQVRSAVGCFIIPDHGSGTIDDGLLLAVRAGDDYDRLLHLECNCNWSFCICYWL